MIYTQFHKRIKNFRSEGAKKYLSRSMTTLLKSHGTISQQSCPHTHQQNGVAECKHRNILEVMKSLLFSTSVSKCYWAEAVFTAALLINMTPSSVVVALSPCIRLHDHSFDYSLFRTFECVCFVLLSSQERDKLSSKISKCIFVGYNSAHKRY